MSVQFVESLASNALFTVLTVSAPVMAVALIVGLSMGIFQATTQINEMTLAFVPKILAVYFTLIVAAGFIIERLMNFTIGIFSDFSRFIQ